MLSDIYEKARIQRLYLALLIYYIYRDQKWLSWTSNQGHVTIQ